MMEVPVSVRKSYTGEKRMRTIGIDRCIAPIVKALLDAGIETEESCCGHESSVGYIAFMDDRVLALLQGKEEFEVAQNTITEFRADH
jgi:hypothetical protein